MKTLLRFAMTAWLFFVLGRHGVSARGGFPGITAVWGSVEVAVASDRVLRARRGSRAAGRPFDWRRER